MSWYLERHMGIMDGYNEALSCKTLGMLVNYPACTMYIYCVVCSVMVLCSGRVQNNILEMEGHDGQSIPKLVGHLDKLVGHWCILLEPRRYH